MDLLDAIGSIDSDDDSPKLPDKCDVESIYKLCTEIFYYGDTYPFDKMNRWLGFIQGVLAMRGIISVDEEREFTRPLFHSLHSGTIRSYPRENN